MSRSLPTPVLLGFSLFSGCLVDQPRGPWLGECAITPEGVYSWGDIGIGTCLAGPVDLAFTEQGGTTWLLVSNADPYRNFQTGSVLAIDYGAIDLTSPRNLVHELPAHALSIRDDDAGDGIFDNAMLGELGVLPDGRVLVPGRFTEDGVAGPSDAVGNLRAGRDELYVLDLSDPTTLPSQTPQVLTLRDDPFLVSVSADQDLAFVGNLTDHSVSVLSVGGSVAPVDVADGPSIDGHDFTDVDRSGSFAELSAQLVVRRDRVPDDHWTATFVEGSVRAYVPEDGGIVRYASGGGEFLRSSFGPEITVDGHAVDPFVFDLDGTPQVVFAEVSSPDDDAPYGQIRYAVDADAAAADWSLIAGATLTGSDGNDRYLGGPSIAYLDGFPWLYYDGRASPDGPSCIFVARAEDGVTFRRELTLLGSACDDAATPSTFEQVAQPFVVFDPAARRYRMWMSAHDGVAWSVATSSSEDGVNWSEPVSVLSIPGVDVGGPSVAYATDHYVMLLAVRDGDGWSTAKSESPDGVHWSSPELVVAPTLPDLGRPQRPGLIATSTSAWSLVGDDLGALDVPIVSGSGGLVTLTDGLLLAVAAGHEVSNDEVPARWAASALRPGSVVTLDDGTVRLYASAVGAAGREHVVALDQVGDGWRVVEPYDAIDDALAAPGRSASDPVVTRDDQGFVMFYAHTQGGETRIRRATSPDGLTWTAETSALLQGQDEWDILQRPHSLELTDQGVTLWYTGDDTSRGRIGAASATDLRGDFQRSPGGFDPWRFGPGTAGSFDDSGVKDPLVLTIDGVRHLFYAGNDGDAWHLGHAVEGADGTFQRRLGTDELSLSAQSGQPGTFFAFGVDSPTLLAADGDRIDLLTSGFDALAWRLGRATVIPGEPDTVYADTRRPTPGDQLSFDTRRGGDGASVIELRQAVDEFVTDGVGMAEMVHDPDRGFLYVTSKLSSAIFVIDVRDDSSGDFVDRNVMNIETLLRPTPGSAAMGFRGLQVVSERGLLYATSTQPDGLWVFDLDRVVDDALRDDQYLDAITVIPLPTAGRDAGARSQAFIGGAGMALAGADRDLLLVTHFRDNSLFVFDLDEGFYGEEVGYAPFLGENPHVVRVAPDGATAVVANYTGDLTGDRASSTLAIIDLDPDSPTFLQPLTWIANQ